MRLDPTLDLSQFHLTPFQLMVATALQRYGAFDADSAGSFKLYAENTIDGSTYRDPPIPLPWSVASHLPVRFDDLRSRAAQHRVEPSSPGAAGHHAPAANRKHH